MKHYLLKNPLVKVVVTREMVKCFESIGNKNTTYQNLLATTKATLGGKFTVLNAYFEKKKKVSNQQSMLPSYKNYNKSKLNPKYTKGRK